MNNLHHHARTCVYSREQIIVRHAQGESAEQIAAAFGISVRALYKWLQCFRQEGPAGFVNRSSAPHQNPNI